MKFRSVPPGMCPQDYDAPAMPSEMLGDRLLRYQLEGVGPEAEIELSYDDLDDDDFTVDPSCDLRTDPSSEAEYAQNERPRAVAAAMSEAARKSQAVEPEVPTTQEVSTPVDTSQSE